MEPEYPLRKLRRDSNLHYRDILAQGQQITDRFPKSKNHLFGIEARGTTNHFLIQAFAEIYHKPVDEIAKIAGQKVSQSGNKTLTTA